MFKFIIEVTGQILVRVEGFKVQGEPHHIALQVDIIQPFRAGAFVILVRKAFK